MSSDSTKKEEEEEEEEEEEDAHPKGAYIDGRKLAILGCNCRFCTQEQLDRFFKRNKEFFR